MKVVTRDRERIHLLRVSSTKGVLFRLRAATGPLYAVCERWRCAGKLTTGAAVSGC